MPWPWGEIMSGPALLRPNGPLLPLLLEATFFVVQLAVAQHWQLGSILFRCQAPTLVLNRFGGTKEVRRRLCKEASSAFAITVASASPATEDDTGVHPCWGWVGCRQQNTNQWAEKKKQTPAVHHPFSQNLEQHCDPAPCPVALWVTTPFCFVAIHANRKQMTAQIQTTPA